MPDYDIPPEAQEKLKESHTFLQMGMGVATFAAVVALIVAVSWRRVVLDFYFRRGDFSETALPFVFFAWFMLIYTIFLLIWGWRMTAAFGCYLATEESRDLEKAIQQELWFWRFFAAYPFLFIIFMVLLIL